MPKNTLNAAIAECNRIENLRSTMDAKYNECVRALSCSCDETKTGLKLDLALINAERERLSEMATAASLEWAAASLQ
jgi:hypothetical protein